MERKLQKNIFKLALPIFIELLFFTLLGTIDTLMLKSYSQFAVGSIANAGIISNLFSVMLTVVATGVVVVLTRALGAKDKEAEPKIVGSGLVFNLCLGLILSVILFSIGGILLQLIKTSSNVYDDALSYLRIVSFTFITLSISLTSGAIFRSYGKPLVIMIIAIISNIINVIINYCLIFGNFGFPELGVTGAAIGTLTSNIFSTTCAVICLYKILGFSPRTLQFSKEYLNKIFRIGGPIALENFLYNFSQFLIMIAVNTVVIAGTTDYSATTRAYVLTIINFIMLFSLSIANANQIIVGYYVGENKLEEAKSFTFRSFRYVLIIVSTCVVVLNIFWRPIMSLFITNEEVLESLNGVFIVVIFLEIGRIFNIVFIAALRAVGDIIFPVVMGIFSMFGIAVSFSFIFAVHLEFGLIGIFMAQALDECFRGVLMLFRWKNVSEITNPALIEKDT